MNIDEIKKAVEWAKNFKSNFKDGINQVKELKYANEMLNVFVSLAEKVIEMGGRINKREVKIKGLQGQMKEGSDAIDCSNYPKGMKQEVISHYQAGYIKGLSIGVDIAVDECTLAVAGQEKKLSGNDIRIGDDFGDNPVEVVVELKKKIAKLEQQLAGKEVSENSTTTFIDKEKQTLTGGKPESLVVNDYTPNHCPHCGKELR
jgi:hypothetical protein